jgi:hypothetical protein
MMFISIGFSVVANGSMRSLTHSDRIVTNAGLQRILAKGASFVAVCIVRCALYNSAGQVTRLRDCAEYRRRRLWRVMARFGIGAIS